VGAWHVPLPDGRAVELRATSRADGDLVVDGPADALARRRRAVVDRPWVWLRQVHGDRVVVVGPDDDPRSLTGSEADAAVSTRSDVALAVHGADCGILGLWSPEGVIGVAHAGWKGLEAGVIPAVAGAMRDLGASLVSAVAGPCIGPECYEFGVDGLASIEARLGPEVRGTTSWGTPALDLPAAVAAACSAADVALGGPASPCTACAVDEHWSHRARADTGRQAMVVWLTAGGAR
jgi:copper oxidase (laccase) domain-containing protein